MLIKEERSALSKRCSEPASRRMVGASTVLERNTTGELLAYAAGLTMNDGGATMAYQTN